MKRMKKEIVSGNTLFFIAWIFVFLCVFSRVPSDAGAIKPWKRPVNIPEPITSEVDPVVHFDISRNGEWIVFSSGRDGFTDLFLRSTNPSRSVLPQRLTDDAAFESAPVFSPDNKKIAYSGTNFDIKGDIYLLDLEKTPYRPVRLTDREFGDEAPCFSANGSRIFFHRSKIGSKNRTIVSMPLSGAKTDIREVETGGDAAFPAISPDGTRMLFVSNRSHAGADIFLLDMKTGNVSQLTDSPYPDGNPVWSPDGTHVYFTRRLFDTNHDGKIDERDNAVICGMNPASVHIPETGLFSPSFLTSGAITAIRPAVSKGRMFFLSDRGGSSNCLAIPLTGVIPRKKTASQQEALAREIARIPPFAPFLSITAWNAVSTHSQGISSITSRAEYRIGKICEDLGFSDQAFSAFQAAIQSAYQNRSDPESARLIAFSRIEQILLRTRKDLETAVSAGKKTGLLTGAMDRLQAIAAEMKTDPGVTAKTNIETARLLVNYDGTPKALEKALDLLNRVLNATGSEREISAEALFLKARVYRLTENRDGELRLLKSLIRKYPDISEWADKGVTTIIDSAVSGREKTFLDDNIRALRKIAEENRKLIPRLSAGALNRIGDLLFAAHDWAGAGDAYKLVLKDFDPGIPQYAAAKLALAEILYREERFRQALDLYETEIAARSYEDRIYHLARAGYIRKSIAAGKYLFRIGEIRSARKTFRELIDYDDSVVEAHRGYIRCAAAMGDIRQVLSNYQKQMKENPADDLAAYATGLCLTYLDDPESLMKAKTLIGEAIRKNGRIEYYHQTLGWIHEILETVHGKKGNLETALEYYKNALYLNNRSRNPDNAADLMLNIGNIHFALKSYRQAFRFYKNRLETKKPFDNPDTEILFYKRLGASAFQADEMKDTITAFQKSLALIDSRMDPQNASDIFDRQVKNTIARFLHKAMNSPKYGEKAKALYKIQSKINQKHANLNQENVLPPPSPGWKVYKIRLEQLFSDQRDLNTKCAALAENLPGENPEALRQNLETAMLRMEKALAFPDRLVQLKVETLDRLGLALQEDRQFSKAEAIFHQVFALNKKLGNTKNLSRNLRSEAYNIWLDAENFMGKERKDRLLKARGKFEEVIRLVDRFGVAEKQDNTGALLSIRIEQAMDASNQTSAGRGFTKDQEIRIAQTFISRIMVELGQPDDAEKYLNEQLKAYPEDKPVPEKDIYGVALLFHRSAHVAVSMGKPDLAFRRFGRSAELCLIQGNPVSAAINVKNMAKLLGDVLRNDAIHPEERLRTLERLDTRTTRLLSKTNPATGKPVIPVYHNAMGVYLLDAATGPEVKKPVPIDRMRLLEKAGIHFFRGLRALESERTGSKRERWKLSAVLHLNLAGVATVLGEPDAQTYYEKALEASVKAMFPAGKWRAEAGLRRYEDALSTLSSMTILNVQSAPLEIQQSLAPVVVDLFRSGKTEEAFNMAERLSELDRFHHLTPLLGKIISPSLSFRDLYPRIIALRELRKKRKTAEGEDKDYLENRIKDEEAILAARLGKDGENLPERIQSAPDRETREKMIILVGLAEHAEQTAEMITETSNEKTRARLEAEYRDLISRYHEMAEFAEMEDPNVFTPEYGAVFGPRPAEAADIMETLPDDGKLIRVFITGISSEPFIVFTVTPDEIRATVCRSIDEIAALRSDDTDFLAIEDTGILSRFHGQPVFLSATHFLRCMGSRKPFKRTLLAIPGYTANPNGFDIIEKQVPGPVEPGVETLLLSTRTGRFTTIPTRSGEIPHAFFGIDPKNAPRIRLDSLLTDASGLSLAILPDLSSTDIYSAGHLFSLFRCPTILFPATSGEDSSFVDQFLASYATTSARNAALSAEKTTGSNGKPKGWIVMGDPGMSGREAATLARQQFRDYVGKAKQAFRARDYPHALAFFEDAADIARESKTLRKYLPALYGFARESAYRNGKLEKALLFAKALSELMEKTRPDSEKHAEALLMEGLILAGLEKNDEAVPILQESAEMFENLESVEKLATAQANLGIVLENATEYDRALIHFNSAVKLSGSLNKPGFMAIQYENIGRIYDLRMNLWPSAIRYYENARTLYEQTGNLTGIAQSLLDIGRCYRLMGNFTEAEQYFSKAMSKLPENDPEMRSKIIIEQANTAWHQGLYEKAFRLQRKCRQIALENNYPLMQVISLNTSGLIWWTLGDHEKALRELDKALAIAKKLKVRDDEIATTLNNIGLVYRDSGEFEMAFDHLNQALSMDERLKSRWAVSHDLRNIGMTWLMKGPAEKAVPFFRKAAAEASAIGNRVNAAKSLLGLGEALRKTGDAVNAGEAFEKALVISQKLRIRETEWRSLFGLARLALERKPPENPKALALLRKAVRIISEMRSDIRIEALKDHFIENKLQVYETLVKLLSDMGMDVEAFEAAEESRARNFIDLLGNQNIRLGRDTDREMLRIHGKIKARIAENEALLANAKTEKEREVYTAALKTLHQEYKDLLIDIQAKNPELSSFVKVNPVKPKELAGIVEPGTALLSYYLLPDEILCWVIRSGEKDFPLVRIPLRGDDIGRKIFDYRRMIQNLEPLEEQSRYFFDLLISPVLHHVAGIRRLGIIPHGPLHYLSFATLSDGKEYLVDKYSLFYLPSAGIFRYTITKRRENKNLNVLAIGNPDLGNRALDLPFAEHEVKSVKWYFDKMTTLTGKKASESWVRDNIHRFGIIYFASHGEFDPVNPLFSRVKLAKDSVADGDLETAEIFGLRVEADMVVLSACQTGLGKITAGDDIIGLNRAFFYAGAHTVISTLWRVSDVSTALLIKHFFREFTDRDKAQALAKAMQIVRHRYPHPGYWGAFCVVGDYY